MNDVDTTSQGVSFLRPVHEAVARLRGVKAVGFAALLGALSALAFAPFHISLILFVTVPGLVWLIDGGRGLKKWGRSVFWRGWGFGFGYFLVSLNWAVSPFLVTPEQHIWFIWMPLFALPGGMAVIWGAACALAASFWSSSPSRVFMFAVFLGSAELVRGTLFGGFPWNLLATTWAPGTPLSQAASLGGIYWLTLVTFLIVAAPAALVDTRKADDTIVRAAPLAFAVCLIGLAWGWGSYRLSNEVVLTERTVVVMDVGVPQNEKFENGGRPVLLRYANLLRDVEGETNDIVIWPEGAMPFDILQSNAALDAVSAYLGRRSLIAGTTRYVVEGDSQVFYNSLAVLRADRGQARLTAPIYNKHRLVPFGELPATRIIPFGEAIAGLLPATTQRVAKNGFEPGIEPSVLSPSSMPPFTPLICYEGLFPEIVRKAVPRPDPAAWIVVATNDAWFGGFDLPGADIPVLGGIIGAFNNLPDMGPSQHYVQHQYRAIENGLPLARSASLGISAIVDPYGRELARGVSVTGDPKNWKSSVARAPLPAPLTGTFFRRTGEALFWLTLVLFSGLAFATWRR